MRRKLVIKGVIITSIAVFIYGFIRAVSELTGFSTTEGWLVYSISFIFILCLFMSIIGVAIAIFGALNKEETTDDTE